jgi:hypothetical protein
MARILLHIGLMKTGTTALQETLYENREQLLTQGVLYPSSNVFQSRHVQLVWSCVTDQLGSFAKAKYAGTTTSDCIQDIQDELQSSGATTCIISAEDFSLYEPGRFAPIIDAFRADLMVIVYLRRQTEMIESMYKQLLKGMGITERFDEFLEKAIEGARAGASPLDYNHFLRSWSELVGADRLVVRVYDRVARYDIVGSFLEAAGLVMSLARTRKQANISFEGPYMEFVRKVNHYLPQNLRHRFIGDLEGLQGVHPVERTRLVSPEAVEMIERKFASSNRAVAAAFFGEQTLFHDSAKT